MTISHKEVRRVNQRVTICRFRRHRESPQCRPGERISHRLPLRRVRTRRAERLVLLHHKNLGPDALKRHDTPLPALTAIETNVVRTEPSCESGRDQELGIEARDLKIEVARALFPIQWKKAVQLLHSSRALFKGRRTGRL